MDTSNHRLHGLMNRMLEEICLQSPSEDINDQELASWNGSTGRLTGFAFYPYTITPRTGVE